MGNFCNGDTGILLIRTLDRYADAHIGVVVLLYIFGVILRADIIAPAVAGSSHRGLREIVAKGFFIIFIYIVLINNTQHFFQLILIGRSAVILRGCLHRKETAQAAGCRCDNTAAKEQTNQYFRP